MSLEQHLSRLFHDIQSCADQQAKDAKAFFSQFKFIPPSISVGDRNIFITKAGTDAIFEISQMIRKNSPNFRAAVSEKEMAGLTTTAIGQILIRDFRTSDEFISIPEDALSFQKSLQQQLEVKFGELYQTRTHLFGAWVFQGTPIASLQIGSVRFLPRQNWVQHAATNGLITTAQSATILESWRQNLPIERAKGTAAFVSEFDIAEAIGECPWTCEITVHGHSLERSREKAIIAAKIALAAIDINWNTSSSSARETGLRYDMGPHYLRTTLTYSGTKFVSASRQSMLRLGRFLHESDVPWFMTQSQKRFETVGAAR